MTPARSSFFGFDLEHDALPTERTGEPLDLAADIVLPPSPTTRTLATLMIRDRVGRALDIGTGCGALALFLSEFAAHVDATDVNPRALAYTERNADANDVRNIRTRNGPLTEPVATERFDLVVGNLPFVISPASTLTFRDGVRAQNGPADLSEAAVAGAARVLEAGGTAQFLVNWVVTDRTHPFDDPVRWIRSTGDSGLVLLHSLTAPDDYVTTWARSRHDDPADWHRHLQQRGAVAIANGAVTIRRNRPGKPAPTIRTARMHTSPSGNGGEQIARILDTRRPSDAEIHAARPRLASPIRWARVTTPTRPEHRDGVTHGDRLALVAANTCGVTAKVPVSVAQVVRRLDGTLTTDEAIDEAIGEAVDGHSRDDHDLDDRLDVTAVTSATITAIRQLVMTGLATLGPS